MSQQIMIDELLSKKKWTVLGASPKADKTSNKILHTLIDFGYQVSCVNPNYDKIEELECYPTIDALPEKPEVVDVVVAPKFALEAIKNLDPSDIPYLWFQPGTFNDEVLSYAKEKGFKFVADGACVMVSLKLGKA